MFHQKTLNRVRKLLQRNNCPTKLISTIIINSLHKISNILLYLENDQTDKIANNNENKKFCILPYGQNLSERIAKALKSNDTQISFLYTNTIHRKFYSKLKLKERLLHEMTQIKIALLGDLI